MHQAFALVRNFSSPVDRLDFGYFSLSAVGPANINEVREIFSSKDVYNGDWVFGKAYAELPPGPAHSPARVGGIPNDVEDMLFLLRLYKVGDVSFVKQCILTPDEKQLIQAPYRVINEGNADSIFTTDMKPEECGPFMDFANGLRKSQSWSAAWFLVARRFFLYGGAKEFSPKWDEVDRIVDYATALEATLVHEMDFSRRRTSQRAAKLVAGDDTESTARVTTIVKKVYDIRSSIVHGSVFSKKHREWLLDNCSEVELCIRQVLVAAVQQMPSGEEDHHKFLTELFDISDEDRGEATMQKFREIVTDPVRQDVMAKITDAVERKPC